MKKFALLITVIALAALAGVSQVVNVSAIGANEAAVTEIQANDFYTPQAYIHQQKSGINHGADTLSFTGVTDKANQVRIADLFSDDPNALVTVRYTFVDSTLVVDDVDLPAGVTAYDATLSADGTKLTVREVKDGITRTRVASAVNRTTDQLSKVESDR